MGNENGEWIMRGLGENDPRRISSPEQLIDAVNEAGFLPLFRSSAPGFSVEEKTAAFGWWSGDERVDPWEWRRLLADSKEVAYGKFFDKKAGFVSLKWFPDFANWRRDGYDFDSLWEDELASYRQKKIMDLFAQGQELFSFDMRRKAGFGKEGEKNFEGVITDLMMRTYLTIRDFRCRTNKQGLPYGWHVAVYQRPEDMWGYDFIASGYQRKPEESRRLILAHLEARFPRVSPSQWNKIMGFGVRHG